MPKVGNKQFAYTKKGKAAAKAYAKKKKKKCTNPTRPANAVGSSHRPATGLVSGAHSVGSRSTLRRPGQS